MSKYDGKDIINNFKELFKQEGSALDIKCCWHYRTNPNLRNPNSHSQLLISTVIFLSLQMQLKTMAVVVSCRLDFSKEILRIHHNEKYNFFLTAETETLKSLKCLIETVWKKK